jgi:hypothetical protein
MTIDDVRRVHGESDDFVRDCDCPRCCVAFLLATLDAIAAEAKFDPARGFHANTLALERIHALATRGKEQP